MPRFSTRYRLPQSGPSAPVLKPFPTNYPDYQGRDLRSDLTQERLNQIPLQNAALEARIAHSQAAEAESRARLNKQIETDRQKTAFYNGLQELESNLNARGFPIGTKEHAEAFATYAHEVPLARSVKSVQDYLKLHSAVHDDQAALTQRLQTAIGAGQAAGMTPQGASFVKGGNVDVRFTQPGAADNEGSDPESELFKSHGVTKTQFLNPLNAKQGVINDKGDFTDKFAPGQTATAIQFQAGNNKSAPSTQITHVMPLQEFNDYRQGFGKQPVPAFQYSGAATPVPTVAPTVPPTAVQPSATPDQTPIYTPSPSPEATATPAQTPIHLGRYNPATGEFE